MFHGCAGITCVHSGLIRVPVKGCKPEGLRKAVNYLLFPQQPETGCWLLITDELPSHHQMKLITLALIAIFLSSTAMPQEKSSPILYPVLYKSGKFGYCDSTGKTIIQPRFDHAQPFKNGYAIVGEHGRYGVIDASEKTIL